MRALHRVVVTLLVAVPALAPAVAPGMPVDDVELPALAGGKAHLLSPGTVNVLVFAKPGHPHCLETLRDLAAREGKLGAARWVIVVPGDTSAADARALAAATGVKLLMVVDVGDALYGKLEVKLQPTVVVVGRDAQVASYEPFREIAYLDRVVARVRFAAGEIGAEDLARAEDPGRSETHSDQGMALSAAKFGQKLLEMGQLELAKTQAQKSLEKTPTSAGYLLQAKVLTKQGKCDEASKSFDMALRLEPKNGDVIAERSRPCPPRRGTP